MESSDSDLLLLGDSIAINSRSDAVILGNLKARRIMLFKYFPELFKNEHLELINSSCCLNNDRGVMMVAQKN